MSGPEHYAKAQELIAVATTPPQDPGAVAGWSEAQSRLLMAAQVHATLALVAATALAAHDAQGRPLVKASLGDARDGWAEVVL